MRCIFTFSVDLIGMIALFLVFDTWLHRVIRFHLYLSNCRKSRMFGNLRILYVHIKFATTVTVIANNCATFLSFIPFIYSFYFDKILKVLFFCEFATSLNSQHKKAIVQLLTVESFLWSHVCVLPKKKSFRRHNNNTQVHQNKLYNSLQKKMSKFNTKSYACICMYVFEVTIVRKITFYSL